MDTEVKKNAQDSTENKSENTEHKYNFLTLIGTAKILYSNQDLKFLSVSDYEKGTEIFQSVSSKKCPSNTEFAKNANEFDLKKAKVNYCEQQENNIHVISDDYLIRNENSVSGTDTVQFPTKKTAEAPLEFTISLPKNTKDYATDNVVVSNYSSDSILFPRRNDYNIDSSRAHDRKIRYIKQDDIGIPYFKNKVDYTKLNTSRCGLKAQYQVYYPDPYFRTAPVYGVPMNPWGYFGTPNYYGYNTNYYNEYVSQCYQPANYFYSYKEGNNFDKINGESSYGRRINNYSCDAPADYSNDKKHTPKDCSSDINANTSEYTYFSKEENKKPKSNHKTEDSMMAFFENLYSDSECTSEKIENFFQVFLSDPQTAKQIANILKRQTSECVSLPVPLYSGYNNQEKNFDRKKTDKSDNVFQKLKLNEKQLLVANDEQANSSVLVGKSFCSTTSGDIDTRSDCKEYSSETTKCIENSREKEKTQIFQDDRTDQGSLDFITVENRMKLVENFVQKLSKNEKILLYKILSEHENLLNILIKGQEKKIIQEEKSLYREACGVSHKPDTCSGDEIDNTRQRKRKEIIQAFLKQKLSVNVSKK